MMKPLALLTLSALALSVLTACERQPETSAISSPADAQLSFDRADVNRDGMVSRNEASTVANLDFGAADTDGNGTLTPLEFEVAMLEDASTPPG